MTWTSATKYHSKAMIPRPKIAPCADCKDRHEGCHSECESYKDWCKRVAAHNQAKRDNYNDTVFGFLYEQNKRKERMGRKK